MLRLALAALLFAPFLQDDAPRKQDAKKREQEIQARLEELEAAASRAETDEQRAEIRAKIEKSRAELEQLRAQARGEGHRRRVEGEELRRRERELQARVDDLARRMDALRAEGKSDECELSAREMKKLQAELEAVRGQMRGFEKKAPPPPPDRPPDAPPLREPRGEEREDVEGALQYAKEFEPQRFRELQRLQAERRHEELVRQVRDILPRLRAMQELRESDPAAYKRKLEIAAAERDTIDMSDRLRKAEGVERARLRDEFMTALGRVFEMRESDRARELEELERRVADLRAMLRKRQENRAKIIEKRAQEMLGEEFDW